ncbi:MAG: energy-coupled thiamine transporter ThiT [Defluviitaleaceae bacterium]|nr:energy-coupled thiamine transporter ThiT [Defluviitaleaceae bacterium]
MKFSKRTAVITACGMCSALSLALNQVTILRMPQGGSLTACGMLFIALAGYWFGPLAGFITGASMGALDFLLGGYVVHPAQLILDYPLAFGLVGLAGCFRKLTLGRKNADGSSREIKLGLAAGYVFGVALRYAAHTLSGLIFFIEYVPEGQFPLLYSLGYNIAYIWPEALITLVLIGTPAFRKAASHVGERITRETKKV